MISCLPRPRLIRTGMSWLLCLFLAACAGAPGWMGSGSKAPPFRDPGLTMQSARDAITAGKTTKAEVMAVLGPATVVKFDSGYEVWAYREIPVGQAVDRAADQAASRAEFIILFAPSGIVKKTRIRPPTVPPMK